jgi:hypothetical protein
MSRRARRVAVDHDGGSFADVREQRHEARSLDSGTGSALEGCATAAPLAREDLILVGAQLLEQTDVLVIDVSRPGATVSRAKPAAILAVSSKLLPGHFLGFLDPSRTRALLWGRIKPLDR